MTLIEVLIAFFILIIGLVGLVTLYLSVSMGLRQSRERVIAIEDMSSVFAQLKTMDITDIKAHSGDTAYWQGFVSGNLSGEAVTVINVNTADTLWDDDPLTLEVEIQWTDRGGSRSVQGVSKFTEPL